MFLDSDFPFLETPERTGGSLVLEFVFFLWRPDQRKAFLGFLGHFMATLNPNIAGSSPVLKVLEITGAGGSLIL
jgi:hypothetical protein